MNERAIPILPADDITLAQQFYVDQLGFTLQWGFTEDGKSGMIGVKKGTIELTIDSPMSGHGRNACASFIVNSADAYYEEWRSRVTIANAPRNENWGARTFGFEDPSGNTLFVIEPQRNNA